MATKQAAKKVGEKESAAPRQGANSGSIKPGEVRNPDGRKGRVKPEEPDGLTDAGRMRRVAEQPPARDCNSAQRSLRKVYEANPLPFIKLLSDLERQ